jgi:LysR family transcriptional regulator, glycine cleavage system transcriptional activator
MRNRNVLPSLDLLAGFEAAARHLSFTMAGEELFITQSAISRQIKELEDQLGVELFHRRHRALQLTEAGQQFYAAAAQVLTTMRTATSRLKTQSKRPLAVTTTASFAALWLIPRLAGFRRTHPEVDVRITADTRVQDLERDGLDIAIRHGAAALAGPNAVRLFGEKVFPVCSPKLLKKIPLRQPADLQHHTLLQYDDPEVRHPWLHWKTWLEVAGMADLRPAGTLSFSGYEQIIPAAIAGHGVALGRSPLLKDLLASKELVAPFKSSADPARAYFAVVSKNAAGRPEVDDFVEWLKHEAATA